MKRLILGLVDPDGLHSNISDLDVKIPNNLWQDLSELGIQNPLEVINLSRSMDYMCIFGIVRNEIFIAENQHPSLKGKSFHK